MATIVEPSPPRVVARSMVAWVLLGTIGSVVLAVVGAPIGAAIHPGRNRWWFNPSLSAGAGTEAAFYAAVLALIVGWIGVGLHARRGQLRVAMAWVILACWGGPLFLAQPLFSRDIYSYVAQGLIAHRGLNPYVVSPMVLKPSTAFSSVATVWHATTSPYGPGFVALSRGTVAIAGHGVVAQLLAFRVIELIGVALVMLCLPTLARRYGNDPGIALWLAALSPLALFGTVASAHNDALMVGLMIAGITVATSGRLAVGIALCALAATIKLPAAGAIVFLAVDAYVRAPDRSRRQRVVVEAIAVPLVIIVAVTIAAGFGWGWIGPKALHIPTELRVMTTPLVSIATFIYHVLHGIGIPVAHSATVTVILTIGEIVTVLGVLYLVLQVPKGNVLRLLGVALILLVAGSPTVWPWYWLWGVTVLAASDAQRSKTLAVLVALAMLVVGAGGTPVLDNDSFWTTAPLLLLGLAWVASGGRWRRVIGTVDCAR